MFEKSLKKTSCNRTFLCRFILQIFQSKKGHKQSITVNRKKTKPHINNNTTAVDIQAKMLITKHILLYKKTMYQKATWESFPENNKCTLSESSLVNIRHTKTATGRF